VVPASAAVTGSAIDEFNWILNTGKTAEAYQNGPAKIVQTSPAPGATITTTNGPVHEVDVRFSEPVNATASAFTVSGPSGTVPFVLGGDSSNAILTFQNNLASGAYTVTVQPTVTSVTGGAQLDGEIPGTALVGQSALPSGNGIAGGVASWTFTVGQACGSADFNCDGDTGTDADIQAFFACLSGANCPVAPCTNSADFNHDGDVGTDSDIESFFRVLGGGSC
jgi:hypothetical protein